MNKYVRFLVLFVIAVAMVLLTWKTETRQQGQLVHGSFPTLQPELVVAISSTPTAIVENTSLMRNLVLVEFFAGY